MAKDQSRPFLKTKNKRKVPRLIIIQGNQDQNVLATLIETGTFDYNSYMLEVASENSNFTEN